MDKTALHLVNVNAISSKTTEVRWTDYRVMHWLSATQHWAWEGGDAIVVVTGGLGNVTCYTVLRVGEKVSVIEGSLFQAMRWAGLDTNNFAVQ